MSHFKAKMYQIRFRSGLRPRPRWGSLQRSPGDPLAGFKGSTSKGREGKGRKWRGREGPTYKGREGKREKECPAGYYGFPPPPPDLRGARIVTVRGCKNRPAPFPGRMS